MSYAAYDMRYWHVRMMLNFFYRPRTDRFDWKYVKLPEFQLKADPDPEILVCNRKIRNSTT